MQYILDPNRQRGQNAPVDISSRNLKAELVEKEQAVAGETDTQKVRYIAR